MTAKVTQPVHIEKKVVVGTALGLLASVGVEVLRDEHLLSSLPANAQPFVRVLAAPTLAFLGGYLAKHSLRSDLTELASEAGLGTLTDPSAAVAVADPAN